MMQLDPSGWVREARATPSPNQDTRPDASDISLIVLHNISLPPGVFGGPQIEQLFSNTLDWDAHPYFQAIRGLRVSSHFLIRRSGQLLQFVACGARAWHAGTSTWAGRERCNDFSIGIELEGSDDTPFTHAQYTALASLLPALAGHYPITAIVGHEHIAPGRKTDPGPHFDWARVRREPAWAGKTLIWPNA
jgi:AmpD protein